MKRLFTLMLVPILLCGCSAKQVYEPVVDVYAPSMPDPVELQVVIPEEASILTGAGENNGALYFCDGYTMTVQTLAGGDLNRSLQTLTGYSWDSLTVVKTQRGSTPCYACAWTSAGEGGDQVGRLVLLDDGAYHYAVTVMAPAAVSGDLAEIWDGILNEVTLCSTDS